MHAHNKKHNILWEGGGQFIKMVLLTNIVTTTGIEKQNAHTHTQNSARIRDGGGRVMKMVPMLNIDTTTGIQKQNTHSLSLSLSLSNTMCAC